MSVTAREAALFALGSYRSRASRPELVLAQLVKKQGMERREAALAYQLTNGVLQNMALCDFYIAQFCTVPLGRLEDQILDILRLSVYQLVFLDRIPVRAAVSEGVALAKKRSSRASGLVNAVLRRVAEQRESLPEPVGTPEERLSVRYSHPVWLVRRLTAAYGAETCEKILVADNREAAVTVQVNTLKTTPRALLEALGGIAEPHPADGTALVLQRAGDVTKLEAFQKGWFYVQDESAKMAVSALGLRPGMTVCDVCAAPGGKSFAAAVQMENRGVIRAFDIHENKLSLIESGAQRLGIDIITTSARDARTPAPELLGSADAVIADVPCSGLGVIRKKPEIRYKKEEELAGLPAIQLDILKNAAGLVKPGGTLLYSTCTILREENGDVVRTFLEENRNFAPEAIPLPAPYGSENGAVTVLPTEAHTDGFYICRLKRIS